MSGPDDDAGSGGPITSAGAERDPSEAGHHRGPPVESRSEREDDRAPDGRPADSGNAPDDEAFLEDEPSDWAWVEEWRAGGEAVPWGPGLALAGFTMFLVASAVYVLSAGLSNNPVVAIGVNVLVAGGLGPALWLSRSLPVLRWIAGGAVLGVLVAWVSVLVFLA